jgi:hypothetical protein
MSVSLNTLAYYRKACCVRWPATQMRHFSQHNLYKGSITLGVEAIDKNIFLAIGLSHRHLRNIDCLSFVMCPLLAPVLIVNRLLFFFFCCGYLQNYCSKQGRWYAPLSSLYYLDVYGLSRLCLVDTFSYESRYSWAKGAKSCGRLGNLSTSLKHKKNDLPSLI